MNPVINLYTPIPRLTRLASMPTLSDIPRRFATPKNPRNQQERSHHPTLRSSSLHRKVVLETPGELSSVPESM
jgi:hypothetical protein